MAVISCHQSNKDYGRYTAISNYLPEKRNHQVEKKNQDNKLISTRYIRKEWKYLKEKGRKQYRG